jgi:hypothetical protein
MIDVRRLLPADLPAFVLRDVRVIRDNKARKGRAASIERQETPSRILAKEQVREGGVVEGGVRDTHDPTRTSWSRKSVATWMVGFSTVLKQTSTASSTLNRRLVLVPDSVVGRRRSDAGCQAPTLDADQLRPASQKRKRTHQPPNLLPAPTLPYHLPISPTSPPCIQQYPFSLPRPLPRLLRKPGLIPTRLRSCPGDRPLRTEDICLAVRRSGDADSLADVGTDGEDGDVGRNGVKGEVDGEGTSDD